MEQFKKVELDLEGVDLTKYQEGGSKHFTAEDVRSNPGNVLSKICSIYHVVRPALGVVIRLPLPQKVKKALETFMNLMDSICPDNNL